MIAEFNFQHPFDLDRHKELQILFFHKHTQLAMFTLLPTLYFYLQFPTLLGHNNVSKYEIIYQWVTENCISRLYSSLVQLISNGTVKTKFAVLAFLYYGEIVKNYDVNV